MSSPLIETRQLVVEVGGRCVVNHLDLAVAAQNGDPFASTNGQIELVDDAAPAHFDDELPGLDQRAAHFGCRDNRKRNTGTPISAVRTPTGNCCGAITVRASVSANTSIEPPASTEAGSNRR